MRNIILATSIIFIIGCNQDSIEKTKELNANNKNISVKLQPKRDKIAQKEIIKKIDNQHEKELIQINDKKEKDLAIIESKKAETLKKLELDSKKELANIELKKSQVDSNKTITIANIESNTKLELANKQNNFYKVVVILLVLVLLIWLILRYLSNLSKQKLEKELKLKELEHQAYLEDVRLKQENIAKMLDIISSKDSDKDVKKAISKLLERGKGNILENKR